MYKVFKLLARLVFLIWCGYMVVVIGPLSLKIFFIPFYQSVIVAVLGGYSAGNILGVLALGLGATVISGVGVLGVRGSVAGTRSTRGGRLYPKRAATVTQQYCQHLSASVKSRTEYAQALDLVREKFG